MSRPSLLPFTLQTRGQGAFLVREEWKEDLLWSSYRSIMTTMKSKPLNPNIRVTAETRKDLKLIAAHTGETMLEVVARLAKHERARLEKGGNNAQKL